MKPSELLRGPFQVSTPPAKQLMRISQRDFLYEFLILFDNKFIRNIIIKFITICINHSQEYNNDNILRK